MFKREFIDYIFWAFELTIHQSYMLQLKSLSVDLGEEPCYELKLIVSSNRTTLVLSNTRELDRELFYKLVYLYSPTGGPC